MGEVALLSLGTGNMLSMRRGLERVGLSVKIITKSSDLASASGIVMPGVGNFGYVSKEIRKYRDTIISMIAEGTLVLGVCLGMQILCEGSEESAGSGLSITKGTCERFAEGLKVPHMGWNTVALQQSSEYFDDISDNAHFYFVHSYFKSPCGTRDEIGVTNYGDDFISVFEQGNVIGTQFHPEKSGQWGSRFLRNFANAVRR